MKRRREEDEIQRAVFKHLRTRGVPNMVAFHCPNGGARSKAEAAILKGLGVTAGVPDIIAVYTGRVYALELKAPTGRIEREQLDMAAALHDAGAIVAVAFSLDQALYLLEAWGLLRGHAQLRTLGDIVDRMDERQNIRKS